MATSGTPSKSSASAPRSAGTAPAAETGARTLGIDIGGSHIKAAVLESAGGPLDKPARIDTPVGSPPEAVVDAIADLVSPLPPSTASRSAFPGWCATASSSPRPISATRAGSGSISRPR